MNHRAVLLRYHEIALKGDNRKWFEDYLMRNATKLLARALDPETPLKMRKPHGRIVLDLPSNPETHAALNRVFGISSYSPIRIVSTDLDVIIPCVLEEVQAHVARHGAPKTFKVANRRSEKALPQTSMELNRIIGSAIGTQYPDWKVVMDRPDLTVGVETRFDETFIWTEKIRGLGGLPVGTNGKLLSLLSGGLDSPIAALKVLGRGSPTSFIHFHGAPFVGEDVLTKIEDLARVINRYQPDPMPLYVIPFGKIQEKIARVTDAKMRTLLYRRMMIRIAERVAQKIGAAALITGESLGQVASQTVENLAVINSVARLPLLRPLLTFNKEDIIDEAHRWGTFEISVRPGIDCCTLFADRHPVLRGSPERLEKQEERFSVSELVEEGLEHLSVIGFD